MMRDWWSDQAQIVWAGIALVLFLSLFIGMLLWVFRPGSRSQYKERARMPLDDDSREAE
jgi:cbb3-type cytochrome oxidase subunit 3